MAGRNAAAKSSDVQPEMLSGVCAALGDNPPANENADTAPHTGPQHRKDERVELSVEFGIDDHTSFYVGFSENMSAGGLFISTYTLVPVGTAIALTCVLPGELPLFVEGVVRWVRERGESETPPGIGVEFLRLGAAEQGRILAYIDSRGRQPHRR